MIVNFFSGFASSFGNGMNKFGTAMRPILSAALSAATQSAMLALAQQIGNMNNPIASSVYNAVTSPVSPTTTSTNPTV